MMADYYDRQQRTILDFFRDSEKMGLDNAAADRKALGEMWMTPTELRICKVSPRSSTVRVRHKIGWGSSSRA
ncbi:MAG: hypothetical protein VXZ99_08945, partial [Pseudomonadota bacterium]|nr:hypothetical protein [Pseudomonadota bacterium]